MSKKVILKSFNGDSFEIEENIALQSQILSHMIEDITIDHDIKVIPLQTITTNILKKVIDYCKQHVNGGNEDHEEEIKKWDSEFVNVDVFILLEITKAAHFLDIKSLFHLTSQTIADIIKDKTVEEIRSILKIECDYTPEEEEIMKRDIQLAFD